jgi:hypothetical protein
MPATKNNKRKSENKSVLDRINSRDRKMEELILSNTLLFSLFRLLFLVAGIFIFYYLLKQIKY